MKDRILVSACLLGTACRYDGVSKTHDGVTALAAEYDLIPICPEVLGGLTTPRIPAEIQGTRVFNRAGIDVTDAYRTGAERVCALAQEVKPLFAVLKARSPACGHGQVYDGTFTGTLICGEGIAASALRALDIPIYTEEELARLPKRM